MGVAKVCALRSKDPNTQVGACIVNEQQQIISTGYNGLPRSLDDDKYPWAREGTFLETKYAYVIHAELNAVLNATRKLKNGIIYVTVFPCHECVKTIIQVGIRHVFYELDKHLNTPSNLAAKKMLADASITVTPLPVMNVVIQV